MIVATSVNVASAFRGSRSGGVLSLCFSLECFSLPLFAGSTAFAGSLAFVASVAFADSFVAGSFVVGFFVVDSFDLAGSTDGVAVFSPKEGPSFAGGSCEPVALPVLLPSVGVPALDLTAAGVSLPVDLPGLVVSEGVVVFSVVPVSFAL